jgi:hypothetical protein
MNEALLIYPNIIGKNQNNVWLGEVRSLVTPIFSYRAVDVHPLMPAQCLSFLLSLLSFPPTPNPLPSGKRALRFASLGL